MHRQQQARGVGLRIPVSHGCASDSLESRESVFRQAVMLREEQVAGWLREQRAQDHQFKIESPQFGQAVDLHRSFTAVILEWPARQCVIGSPRPRTLGLLRFEVHAAALSMRASMRARIQFSTSCETQDVALPNLTGFGNC